MRKRIFSLIFLLIFSLIFLTSCGRSNNETKTEDSMINISDENFSINIPANWSDITSKRDLIPEQKVATVEKAFSTDEIVNGFYKNILILSQRVPSTSDSLDFAIKNNIGSQKEYLEYTQISRDSINIGVEGESTNLYVFEAKYNTTTPMIKYLQAGVVCDMRGYLITIAVPTSDKATQEYKDIIKSFKCK